MAARECYVAMLEMDDHLQDLNIEERKVAVELTEDLEEISLDNNIPSFELVSARRLTLQFVKSLPSS